MYHQVNIVAKYWHKTTFVIAWGSFDCIIMPFGLKNASFMFFNIVVVAFQYFINKFLEV